MMDISSSFAVIYRFYLQPSKEEKYVSHWKIVSNYFTKQRGAIASTLHKTEEGYWLAYSKWPDKKTRDASWQNEGIKSDLPEKIQKAIEVMKSCGDTQKESFPEICMAIIEQTDSNKRGV